MRANPGRTGDSAVKLDPVPLAVACAAMAALAAAGSNPPSASEDRLDSSPSSLGAAPSRGSLLSDTLYDRFHPGASDDDVLDIPLPAPTESGPVWRMKLAISISGDISFALSAGLDASRGAGRRRGIGSSGPVSRSMSISSAVGERSVRISLGEVGGREMSLGSEDPLDGRLVSAAEWRRSSALPPFPALKRRKSVSEAVGDGAPLPCKAGEVAERMMLSRLRLPRPLGRSERISSPTDLALVILGGGSSSLGPLWRRKRARSAVAEARRLMMGSSRLGSSRSGLGDPPTEVCQLDSAPTDDAVDGLRWTAL